MTEEKPPKKAAREPQALSSEYHKARKQLMLWAGILFIWALVGIDLDKAKQSEGNVGALINSIKSLHAVPWVLLIMVGYFLFKTRIEWRQCSASRREVREAKQDYYSGCFVAGSACLLYVGQAVSRIQIADIIRANPAASWSLFWGFTLFLFMIVMVKFLRSRQKTSRLHSLFIWSVEIAVTFVALTFTPFVSGHPLKWPFALLGVFSGSTVALLVFFFPSIYKQRKLNYESSVTPS